MWNKKENENTNNEIVEESEIVKVNADIETEPYMVFGAIPDPKDARDYIASSAIPDVVASLPQSVDISNQVLVVKNQGQEGTCVANAGSALKEFFDRVRLSVRFLYYFGRQISGMNPIATPNVDEGMVPRDMMKCLLEKGDCLETSLPYQVFGKQVPSAQNVEEAKSYKIKSYARILTVNDLKAHLNANRTPAVLTVPIYDGAVNWFTQNVKTNNYTIKVGGTNITSGHAILVVGYDENRQAFKILNSWGTFWGENGYAWLPYNYAWNDCWTGVDTDGTFGYDYVSQTPNPRLHAGESGSVKITLRNSGSADWLPNVFKIGTSLPIDRPSALYNSDWTWINRPTTVDRIVKPGETYEFTIPITVPKNAKSGSNYIEYLRPVVEGVMWLKDIGIYFVVDVT